ncbi:MAG: Ig-like domain-containing protein [Anaerolineae bacterium]|nr:Ig-like domain-containing protein [Anaerolineae bacterium]
MSPAPSSGWRAAHRRDSDLRGGANALTWDAEATGLGLRQLEIRLTDTTGAQQTATRVVSVVEPLRVTITAPAPNALLDATQGAVEVAYTAEANAGFVQRVALLVDGAEVDHSVALDSTGALTWDPADAALGAHTLVVSVTDSNGYRASDAVTIAVTRPLRVALGLSPGARVAGAAVEVPFTLTGRPADVRQAVFLVDDRRVAAITALQRGANALTWDATTVELGPHTLEVRLTDTLGNEYSATAPVVVVEPLRVAITAPAPNTTASGVVDVAYEVAVNAGTLARVVLLVDGALVDVAEGGELAGALIWDTAAAPLGARTLAVLATTDRGTRRRPR